MHSHTNYETHTFARSIKEGTIMLLEGRKEKREQKQKQKFLPHKEAGVSQDYQLPDY
jgi:hypothetical protein